MLQTKKYKVHCIECKGKRNHESLYRKNTGSTYPEQEEGEIPWSKQYHIIKCFGCDNISFMTIYSDQSMIHYTSYDEYEYYEEVEVYPQFLEKGQKLEHTYHLPKKIKDIYIETLSALKAKAYILTAGGFRTIIESVCTDLEIPSNRTSLQKRIDKLHTGGHLTKNDADRLHSIRFIGNDSLHRTEAPKKENLYLVLDIVNNLLSNLYITDKIIKGNLSTMIKTNLEFGVFLSTKITHEMVNKELTLKQLMGDDIRRIYEEDLNKFESDLVEEIKNNKYPYLEPVKPIKVYGNIFKAIKVPEPHPFINFTLHE